jgi:hypothetical protein
VLIAVLHDPVKSFFSKLIRHPSLKKYKLRRRLSIVKKLIERKKVFGEKFENCKSLILQALTLSNILNLDTVAVRAVILTFKSRFVKLIGSSTNALL